MRFIISDGVLNGGSAAIGIFREVFNCGIDVLAESSRPIRAGGSNVGVGQTERVKEAAVLAIEITMMERQIIDIYYQ